jgi:hypothetical protein
MRRVTLIRVLAAATVLSAGAPVFAADGEIDFVANATSGDRRLAVAASDRGLIFIGSDFQLFRAYHNEQSTDPNQPSLWVTDIDQDGNNEYIGAGTPSFIVDDNADPMWGMLEGCVQFFVGDFIDDRSQEVLCRGERKVNIWSYDGQAYFEWEGRGMNITGCEASDVNGDNKTDLSCALSSGNNLLFDFAFTEPEETDVAPTPGPAQGGVDTSDAAAAAAGTQTLDVGGRSVALNFDAGSLQLTADGAVLGTATLPTASIHSAAAVDLDGDGTEEIVVGGTDRVWVISSTGAVLSDVAANPFSTRRDGRVTVRSATANGLENSDRDAVRAVVDAGVADMLDCYSSSMGSDQFTRVGNVLYELEVSSSGSVSDSTRRHSDLNSDALESCLVDVFESMSFSPATDGAGVVSINVAFDFVDMN